MRRAVVQYKNFAFSGILERSVSFVSQENSAKFISILTNDVASIETNYLAKVFTLVMELAGFVGALGMMLWYSPILTAAAAVLALLPVGASLLCGDRLARCEAEVSAKNESYVETVKESFAGFSVIKSFRAEASVRGMFEQVSGSLEDAKYSRRKVNDLVYMLAGARASWRSSACSSPRRSWRAGALPSARAWPWPFCSSWATTPAMRAASAWTGPSCVR